MIRSVIPIVEARGQPAIAPISRTAASWAQTNRPATTVSIDPRRAWQPRAPGQRECASADAGAIRRPVRLEAVPRTSSATMVPPMTTAGAQSPRVPSASSRGGSPSQSAGELQTAASASGVSRDIPPGAVRRADLPEPAAERHEPGECDGSGDPPRERDVAEPETRETVRRDEEGGQPGQGHDGRAARRKDAAPAAAEQAAVVASGAGSGLRHRRPLASGATTVNRSWWRLAAGGVTTE